MGEPLPGDIPDPTHLKTQNVLLKEDIVASKGEWLVYAGTPDFSWTLPIQTIARIVSNKEAVQLQEDINTTNLINQGANAAAFANGSWIYALIGGTVEPNSPVHLVVYDSGSAVFKIGFVNAFSAAIASIAVTLLLATIVTTTNHNLKVGQTASISDATNSLNNGDFIVTEVIDSTSYIVQNSNAVAQGSAGGNSINDAELNGGTAKFIKRSGDTFDQEGSINEIGVFAMTGLGL